MMDWLSERFAPGPLFGWLCVIIMALIPLMWTLARRRRRPTVRFSSFMPLQGVGASWAVKMRWTPLLLRTLAILALVISLARPQSGGEYHSTSEGIAIQMVLDVSGSMREDDFIVNGRRVRRLDAVKKVFEDFVLGHESLRGRENDLVGMTTFAMYADTICPLTLDHGSLRDLLREADIPGWVNGQLVREQEEAGYTGLGDAIVLATDDLRRAGEQAVAGVPGAEAAKSRVLILLTDGADNPAPIPGATPPDPIEAAKVAATLGIKIYTIGAQGTAPQRRTLFAPMQGFDPRAERTLQGIAEPTGGRYFRATDTESLKTIYDEIDKLERRRTGERSFQDNVWASNAALLAGLGLLVGEMLLVNTRFRRIP